MSAETSLAAAVEWLKETLSGPMQKSSKTYKSAVDEGISQRTLQRAKKELCVKSIKMHDGWYWSLTKTPHIETNASNQGEETQDGKEYELTF